MALCCSIPKSCPTLCNLIFCSMPGLTVLQYLLEFVQTHVHWIDDAIKPFHPLLSPFPKVLNFPQHQGLFQWVSSFHKWPKCWSFSIRLSNEYSGLFSFRINWFDLPAFQGTCKSLLQHNSKAFILWCSGFTWWLRRWRIRLQCKRLSLNPWVGKISLRREWLPNPYSCLENSIDRGA